MKILTLAVASLFTAAAPALYAQDRYYNDRDRDSYRDRPAYDERRGDTARVLESRPLYAVGEAREECWNPRANHYEEVRHDEHGNRIGAGAAVGAVAGGVIGNQFSHGTGTAVGAVIGGLIGNKVQNDRREEQARQDDLDFSRCRTLGASGPVQGYDVRYRYRGQEYVARMDHDPGPQVRIGQDTRPDGSPIMGERW